jgi:gas vesicle protein
MSDLPSKKPDDVVIVGDDELHRKREPSLFGSDAISALNIWFLMTTVVGAVSEYFASPTMAVAAMLVFLIYGFVFRRSVPNIERFADASYYQGFILTLFALLMAMTGKGAQTITSEGMIQQFGLAIWTTFVGMSGRIFIIQFLTTTRDEDEGVREEISAYVAEVHKEIASTLSQLRIFRESVLGAASQIAKELSDEAKKSRQSTDEAVKNSLSSFVQSISQSTARLDKSVERVAERIANIEIPTDVLSHQIRKIADAVGGDLDKMRSDLESNSTKFAEMLKGNVAVVESTRHDLDVLRQLLGDVNRSISEAGRTTSETLANTRENLAASSLAVRGVEQLGRTAETLAERLTLLTAAFDQRAQSYSGDMDRIAKEMAETAKLAREAAYQAREDTSGLANAVIDGAHKITVALKEARHFNESAE